MSTAKLCRHLRAKNMFVPALAQPGDDQPPTQPPPSAHFWCNCTLTETGPDDKPVGSERCHSLRSCFEE